MSIKQFIEDNAYIPYMGMSGDEVINAADLEAYMVGKVVVDKKFIKALHDEATHNEDFPFELYLELDEMLSTQEGE